MHFKKAVERKMSNYSVLIVDDEEEVANAIIQKIDWNGMGFSVPVYAANGLDALDRAEENAPDVVMTDIKMPYMDGLELGRNLKSLYPNIRIVFFSGFDEFEYVKEAIHVQAQEYILKPVDAEELKGIFKKLKDSLDKEMETKQNAELLEKYYQESLPVLQESFYASLVEGKIKSDSLDKNIKDYQIDLQGPYYCVAVIHTSSQHLPEKITPMLLGVSVRKLAEERLDAQWQAKFFSNLGNTVVLAQLEEEQQVKTLTDECDAFCRLAKTVCKAVVTVGIGPVCSNLADISNSYNGARSAVSYRVLYGTGKAINITEIAPQEADEPIHTEDDQLQRVFKAARINDADSLKAEIHAYLTPVH
jgi:two-component system response regulator YesN